MSAPQYVSSVPSSGSIYGSLQNITLECHAGASGALMQNVWFSLGKEGQGYVATQQPMLFSWARGPSEGFTLQLNPAETEKGNYLAYFQMLDLDGNSATKMVPFQISGTTQHGKSAAARTIGPLGVPSALLHELWRLRERFIRPEVHRRLHPLV